MVTFFFESAQNSGVSHHSESQEDAIEKITLGIGTPGPKGA